MKFKRVFIIIVLVSIFYSCQINRKNLIFVELKPIVFSSLKRYDFSTLSDDFFLRGNWSGPFAWKKPYRILRDEAEVFFYSPKDFYRIKILIEAQPYAKNFIDFYINGKFFKKIKFSSNSIETLNLFIPSKRTKKGLNILKLKGNAKIYSIVTMPLKSKLEKEDTILLPAELYYYLYPKKGDEFIVRFNKKVENVKLILNTERGKINLNYKDKSELKVKLDDFRDNFLKLKVSLSGKGTIKILNSGYQRKLTPLEENEKKAFEVFKNFIKNSNILYVILDSSRRDHFSSYGYSRKTTPEIDKLKESSIIFKNVSTEAVYTLASTATLFSALEPELHNVLSDYSGGLSNSIETLAEVLKMRGFYTGAISSIPYCGKAFNMQQGFDEFIELFKKTPQPMGYEFKKPFKKLLHHALESKKRFFIYLHIREPHIDYLMEPPFYGKFRKRFKKYPSEQYLSYIKKLYFLKPPFDKGLRKEDVELLIDSYDENLLSGDHYLGELIEILKEKNLYKKSIIFISGDHGEALYEHKLIGHNVVLYEEGVKIPLIIHVPGLNEKIEINYPLSNSDVSRTIMKLFSKTESPDSFIKPKGLFLKDEYKIIVGRTIFFKDHYPSYFVKVKNYKCIVMFDRRHYGTEVYNLLKDPEEKNDISQKKLYSKEFCRFILYNYFTKKKNFNFKKASVKLSKKDIESLKSLGYLGD